MFFTIARKEIVASLQLIVTIAEKKQVIPILADVFIRAEEDSVTLIGTDLEIQLSSRIVAKVEQSGSLTVSGKKLYDICRNFPENADIRFEENDNELGIRYGRSRFYLKKRTSEDFPLFSSREHPFSFNIKAKNVLSLFKTTSFCMASNDIRYYLNGMLVEIDGGWAKVTTSDGHRLAMHRLSIDEGNGRQLSFILPRKAVLELIRILDLDEGEDIEFNLSDSDMEISVGGRIFCSKLIEAKFPDFESTLSKDCLHRVYFETAELKAVLTRISVLSTDRLRKVTLNFSQGSLLIRSENMEHERASEELDVEFYGSDYEANLNIAYLLEAINNVMGEEVELSFLDESDVCLVRGKGYENLTYVVMPLY